MNWDPQIDTQYKSLMWSDTTTPTKGRMKAGYTKAAEQTFKDDCRLKTMTELELLLQDLHREWVNYHTPASLLESSMVMDMMIEKYHRAIKGYEPVTQNLQDLNDRLTFFDFDIYHATPRLAISDENIAKWEDRKLITAEQATQLRNNPARHRVLPSKEYATDVLRIRAKNSVPEMAERLQHDRQSVQYLVTKCTERLTRLASKEAIEPEPTEEEQLGMVLASTQEHRSTDN